MVYIYLGYLGPLKRCLILGGRDVNYTMLHIYIYVFVCVIILVVVLMIDIEVFTYYYRIGLE